MSMLGPETVDIFSFVLSALSKGLDRCKFYVYLALTRATPQPHIRNFRFGIPLIMKTSKWGRSYSTEADALQFLNSACSTLPIPRLVDSIRVGESQYTIMTKLPGRLLYFAWRDGEIDQARMRAICLEVASVMHQLWAVPQSPADAGRVMLSASGDGLPDPRFFHEDCSGPYDSILECYQNISSCQSMEEFEENSVDSDRQSLAADRIVWVHPDLRMYNVLVDRDHRLSGIIDWEDSGWYPMQWQLWSLKCRPVQGGSGQWFTFWRKYEFPVEAERAYEASQKVLLYPLVP
ncbi:kinase-like protein [Laetiporus sulphureus 93-53]|uniref:Kinase-like protein n=1 Tax=Laetiporus sulphureus 93-53 TaxID=1314785 RepID=A0A165FC97_9APHY|nr:kinase-like protein [Laetiporus sulphureus 93-53]KZT08752.1 kinase-like protein [Laetiporus sulphureus 93-53]